MADDQWGAGNPDKWSDHGEVMMHGRRLRLIYGEHPHSRSDNHHYALMDGKPMEFDGHRILISVSIESENYLKESELSGNQIRKGGTGRIFADGLQVFEFFFRDPQWALLHAHHLIGELREHSSGWMIAKERAKLKGRKVFYREHPAIIQSLIVDQGCLILTADGEKFPKPAYADDENAYEPEREVKIEVNSPHIWWWRK
jgi:hypothetical protein